MNLIKLIAIVFLFQGCIARSSHVDQINEVVLDNAYAINEINPTPNNAQTAQKAAELLQKGSAFRVDSSMVSGLESLLGPFSGLAGLAIAEYMRRQKKGEKERAEYATSKARKWARMDKSESEKELVDDNSIPT